MTRYAVGDIQGCLKPLKCLLETVAFDPNQDQLWLVGDLINRGPDSLETLRFIKALGSCTKIVLGNHDLHFLAVAFDAAQQNRSDTLTSLLEADDRDELVSWLRNQHLLYTDPSGDYSMTHAGIPPIWTLDQAQTYAQEVETILRSDQIEIYLRSMYGNKPDRWNDKLTGWDRTRLITNYFTRMRFCRADGTLDLKQKQSSIDNNLFAPWFAHRQRKTANNTLIFGHWASLQGNANASNVYALDTGCVWGASMTIMNLEDKTIFSCDCSAQQINQTTTDQ
jgi:bis(5'-nucleosyl)-tetraphosphatase (symmetrical)